MVIGPLGTPEKTRTFVFSFDEKYAKGGYLHLWLNSERNVQGLAQLRTLIHDEPHLRSLCREWFDNHPQN